jgi:hypothetical protein
VSYSLTSRLGLKKAVVGSNQAFETSVFNTNLDAVDAEFVAVDGRLDGVESSATSLDGRLDVVEPKVTALEALTGSGQVNSALKLDGRKLTVGSSQPVSPAVGDLWIQV